MTYLAQRQELCRRAAVAGTMTAAAEKGSITLWWGELGPLTVHERRLVRQAVADAVGRSQEARNQVESAPQQPSDPEPQRAEVIE